MTSLLQRQMTGQWGTIGRLTIDPSDSDALSKEEIWVAERPWAQNRIGESCIKAGTYLVVPHTSKTKNKKLGGKVFLLSDTSPRSAIYWHIGNFPLLDSQGCLLPGSGWSGNSKAEEGKQLMVTSSTNTMQKMLTFLIKPWYLVITEAYSQ